MRRLRNILGSASESELNEPLPLLFVTSICFAGVLRVLEAVISASSTFEGFIIIWQEAVHTPWSVGTLVVCVCGLFLFLSLLVLMNEPKKKGNWATVLFCLILFGYGFGLNFYTEQLAFVFEQWGDEDSNIVSDGPESDFGGVAKE